MSVPKILFLTDNFVPEVNAPATRTYEHCLEWVKKGADVTVITCNPNFPKGKVFDGYRNKLYQKETIDGIKVVRVWSYIAANKGFVKRIADYASFSMMSFFAGLFIKTDLIVATSPQFFTAFSGRWLSFFKRRPWVMEVRDLWPESIVAVGAMQRNGVIRFFEGIEKRFYRNASRIVVVTDAFKQVIAGKDIEKSKVAVYKNGVNLELFSPRVKNLKLIEDLKLKNKIIFGYIGTQGMAHGLDFILKSIAQLQVSHPHFHFLFIGDGAKHEELIRLKKELRLKNADFLPMVPKAEIVNYLSILDVALVNLIKSDTFRTVIPSKIFEAAAMGKPILLGVEGEAKDIVESFNAGRCFEPGNTIDFIEKAIDIIDPERYEEYVSGCMELAHSFDRKKIAGDMLTYLEGVV